MYLGNCKRTHSDVARSQFEVSSDPEKPSLVRKYELDLLSHLERIIDSVEIRVRKQLERINAAIPVMKISETKEREIGELNKQVSVTMREVERLAESGMLEESGILMGKVTELQNRINELSEDKFAKYVKKEVVCETCGVLIGAGIDEKAHDHIRGKQHMGVERVRLKVIELKTRYKIPKNKRDLSFTPSIEIKQELEREGVQLVVPLDVVDSSAPVEPILPTRGYDTSPRIHQERKRDRSDSRLRAKSRNSRDVSSARSISPISFSEDEFGRKKRRPMARPRQRSRSRDRFQRRRRSPPRRARSRSMESVASVKSMASIAFE
jgi:hypothetical protein